MDVDRDVQAVADDLDWPYSRAMVACAEVGLMKIVQRVAYMQGVTVQDWFDKARRAGALTADVKAE